MRTSIEAILGRLAHPDARVRRIAAMDLRTAELDQPAIDAITPRLSLETDESVLITLVRRLSTSDSSQVMAQLRNLRDNPDSDARVAHAALLACDAIELRARTGT